MVGDQAEATVSNPAGLSFDDRVRWTYTYVSGQQDWVGHGHAFLLALPLGNRYSMGIGYERLDLPGFQDSLPTKWSWSHGLRLSEAIGLGVGWHSFDGKALGSMHDQGTLTAGLQLRPIRWLAFGFTGEYLNGDHEQCLWKLVGAPQ